MSSAILTREVAIKAIELVRPAILRMMETGEAKRPALDIVILDPTVPFGEETSLPILHEESFGRDSESWKAIYADIAAGKARISWRTGMDTLLVKYAYPTSSGPAIRSTPAA